MAAAAPFKRSSALLAATIWAGSSLSLTCETASEYSVRANPLKRAASVRNIARGIAPKATMHAIRQPADRLLCYHGGANAQRHERGHPRGRQAAEPCVHGAHREYDGADQT